MTANTKKSRNWSLSKSSASALLSRIKALIQYRETKHVLELTPSELEMLFAPPEVLQVREFLRSRGMEEYIAHYGIPINFRDIPYTRRYYDDRVKTETTLAGKTGHIMFRIVTNKASTIDVATIVSGWREPTKLTRTQVPLWKKYTAWRAAMFKTCCENAMAYHVMENLLQESTSLLQIQKAFPSVAVQIIQTVTTKTFNSDFGRYDELSRAVSYQDRHSTPRTRADRLNELSSELANVSASRARSLSPHTSAMIELFGERTAALLTEACLLYKTRVHERDALRGIFSYSLQKHIHQLVTKKMSGTVSEYIRQREGGHGQ